MAKKYKFKPNKSLLKRVKVTGRGKVKFHHAGASRHRSNQYDRQQEG